MFKPLFFRNIARLVTLFALVSLAPNSRADGELDPRIEKLLLMRSRPTVEQVLETYGEVGRANPMRGQPYGYTGTEPYRTNTRAYIMQRVPRLIAAFELVYPGAVYGGLGRDSARLVDLLSAFYLNLGQRDRAIRLNASGDSLRASSSEQKVRFLESNGVSLDPAETNFAPLIIFDATGFSPRGGSQSTSLLQAAVEVWARNGGTAAGFIQRINVIASQIYAGNPINSRLSVSQVFARQVGQLEAANLGTHQTETFSFNGAENLNYGTYFWHETFPRLVQSKRSGKFEGSVPRTSSAAYRHARIQVLGHIFDAIQMTRSEAFLENVRQEAAKLGYRFSEKRVLRLPVFKPPTERQLARQREAVYRTYLKDTLKQIDWLAPEQKTGYLSNVALAYARLVRDSTDRLGTDRIRLQAALEVLARLEKDWKSERIGDRDLRRLGAILMTYIGAADARTAERIKRILQESPKLKRALQTRWLSLTDPEQERRLLNASGLRMSDVAGAYQAWIKQGLLRVGRDCRDVLLNGAPRPESAEDAA